MTKATSPADLEKTLSFLHWVQKNRKPIVWGSMGTGTLAAAAAIALMQQQATEPDDPAVIDAMSRSGLAQTTVI